MTTTLLEQNKQALVADFIHFLDHREEPELPNSEVNPPPVDLFSLFLELTALKTEVKQESRLFKTILTQIQSLLTQVESNHERLDRELEQRRQEQHLLTYQQQQSLQKPLLLAIVDWRDRLARSLGEVTAVMESQAPHRSLLRRWWRPRREPLEWVAGWREGQQILLRHLDQVLETYEVTLLPARHRPYDPQTMRAVGFESHPNLPETEVVKELRSGFLWQGALLRTADVIVNRYRGE